MGRFDDILASVNSSTGSLPSARPAPKAPGKYDDILAGLPSDAAPVEDTTIGQDYPGRRTLSKFVLRPLIEGGAMTLGAATGAMLGAPAGPLGAALGGYSLEAAMYPPAHEFANKLDDAMGIGGRRAPQDDLERTLGELQTGLGIAAGGKVLGTVANKGIEAAVRKGVPTFLGPSREAVAARMDRPDAIRKAPTYLQQAETLPKALNGIQTAISKADEAASKALRTSPNPNEGAVPVSKITGILQKLQDRLKVGQSTVGASDQAATARLGALARDVDAIIPRETPAPIMGPSGQSIVLRKAEAYIPEADLKKLIQRIRKDINFDDKAASVTNSVLTDTSGQLDEMLKAANPKYKKAMQPVSKLMGLYNDARDAFSLTKRTGEGLMPSDQTISSMKTLPSERRGVSQGVARRLKAATKVDLIQQSKDRALADQFVGGNAQGTRRTFGGSVAGSAIGTALGTLVGHPTAGASIGSTAGAVAGMASDVSGREMGAKIIDSYLRAKPWLAKLPYEVVVRLISSGAIGGPE